MKQPPLMIVFIIILSAVLVTFAQQPKPTPKQTPTAKPESTSTKGNDTLEKAAGQREAVMELTSLQLRGLDLVKEAAREVTSLDDKRSSALIQARAADLLWSYDKERSKEIFASAFEIGMSHYLTSSDLRQQQASKNASVNKVDVLLELIQLISKHDTELAGIYIDKYVELKARLKTNASATANETRNRLLGEKQSAASSLWRVALHFLETNRNPKLSREIAQRALALTVTPESIFYMLALAEHDRSAADQLYVQALNRMRADPQPLVGPLVALSDYSFATGKIRLTDGINDSQIHYIVPANFQRNPQLVNQFLIASFDILTRATQPTIAQQPDGTSRLNTAFYFAKYLEPKVAEFQPAILDKWQALISRLTATLEENARQKLGKMAQQDVVPREQRQPTNPQAEVSDILARADKATNINQRDNLYIRAALSANQAGDSEKALEIVGKVADLSLRQRVKSWVSFYAAERARIAKKWEEARRYAIEVEAIDERAYLLLQLATALQKEKNVTLATEILEVAFRQTIAAENTSRKVKALVGIANNFAATDFIRGYEVIEVAFKTTNQVPRETSLLPDDIYLTRVLEMGGSSATNSQTFEGFDLGMTLVKLAKHDTERGLSILQTLDNLPLRYSATVTLAGLLLRPTEK